MNNTEQWGIDPTTGLFAYKSNDDYHIYDVTRFPFPRFIAWEPDFPRTPDEVIDRLIMAEGPRPTPESVLHMLAAAEHAYTESIKAQIARKV